MFISDTKLLGGSKNETMHFGEKVLHIIDLTQTVEFLKCTSSNTQVISSGGKMLIVSTKKQLPNKLVN